MGAHGYTEEEYFAQGMARSYKPVARWLLAGRSGWDGELQDARDCTSAEGSRSIQRNPPVGEWANVSTFNDISNAVNERFHASGYAYAARLILPQWTSRDLEVAAICLAGLI
jgi:hypothetical protein